MKVSVIIISMLSKLLGHRKPFTYSVSVEKGNTVRQTLAHAYALTNHDLRPLGSECCATSPGDLMLHGGKYYLVQATGFKRLKPKDAMTHMALDPTGLPFIKAAYLTPQRKRKAKR